MWKITSCMAYAATPINVVAMNNQLQQPESLAQPATMQSQPVHTNVNVQLALEDMTYDELHDWEDVPNP